MYMRLLVLTALLASSDAAYAESEVVSVPAWRETVSAPSTGDAADDPAIWVHPTDPAQSLVIGTNKEGGLLVMDLEGKSLQYLAGSEPNNVDLRSGFPLGGRQVTLVAASDRSKNTIAAWVLDEKARQLTPIAVEGCVPAMEVYGFGLYHSARTGAFHAFITSKTGATEQWQLEDKGDGTALSARRVREFKLGGQCEGAAADDASGMVYIGEEEGAVWRINAEPDADAAPVAVDYAQPKGKLITDIEGIAIGGVDPGYLVVSCQGNNSFNVYERSAGHKLLGAFRIVAGNGVDEVTHTDGIEVSFSSLGAGLEGGLFVAQDDEDDSGNQNFKLVPWASIAEALKLPR